CQSSEQDRSTIGAIIKDIQEIKVIFNSIGFCHIPRTENTYAHLVATEALKKREGHYLVGAVPNIVRRAVEGERLRYQN
ncbi:hypothetical protein Goklo_016681, partial [Gossypium klotzschianum]|nr:hypothetical protein [Gossypium klotzschianum]